MKKLLAIILSLIMILTVVPMSVLAADGTSGTCGENLTWTFNPDTGELAISGEGAMYDYDRYYYDDDYYSVCPWYSFRSEISTVTISDGVTSIGDYAFYGCAILENVSIGSGVTDIGDCAFLYCDSIIGFDVSEDNIAYSNDEFGVLFNKDKTKLIQYPNCLSLSSYTIPYGVTTIGKLAFAHIGVELPIDREYVYNDFGDKLSTIIISESVTRIEHHAFENRYGIINMVIPDSVTTLDPNAFYGCFNLSSITLGKGIAKINSSVFRKCISLKDIYISNNITEISDCAFEQCDSLTNVYYNGLEEEWNKIKIGDDNEPLLNATIHYKSGPCGDNLVWSFNAETGELTISGKGKMKDYSVTEPAPWDEYKDQIKKIIVSEDVTTIGNDTFNGCKNLEEVSLPSTLTKIGNSAFRDCVALDEIEIPETVKSLGHYAFYGCTGLKDINVGDSVQTIGNYAFRKCSNLKSVTLPEALTRIGKGAFMECPSLFEAEYKGTDEQWAEVTVGENNEALLDALKGIVIGDVNGDGKINSLDALYCLNHATEKTILEGKTFLAADVDKNGKANSMDALKILNFAVGKIKEF